MHHPTTIPPLIQQLVHERDGRRCQYCQDETGPFELDHIFPQSLGGTNAVDNLVVACRACNKRRGAKSLRAFGYPFDQLPKDAPAFLRLPLVTFAHAGGPTLGMMIDFVTLRGHHFGLLRDESGKAHCMEMADITPHDERAFLALFTDYQERLMVWASVKFDRLIEQLEEISLLLRSLQHPLQPLLSQVVETAVTQIDDAYSPFEGEILYMRIQHGSSLTMRLTVEPETRLRLLDIDPQPFIDAIEAKWAEEEAQS